MIKDKLREMFMDYQMKVIKAKDQIVFNHKDLSSLYYIEEGRAKIYMVHENGNRSLIQFLEAGDLIGELSLINVEREKKDVIAITDLKVKEVSLQEAKDTLLKDDKFLLILNQYLGHKLLERTQFYAHNQNYELKHRLATYILMSEHQNFYHEKHTETSEFLGVSYRHLLHTFKVLESEGYIIKKNRGYIINKDNLKSLSIK